MGQSEIVLNRALSEDILRLNIYIDISLKGALNMRAIAFALLVCAIGIPGSSEAAEAQPPRSSLQVHALTDATGGTITRDTREAVTRSLVEQLRNAAFAVEGGAAANSILDVTVVSCREANDSTGAPAAGSGCMVAVTVTQRATDHVIVKFALQTPLLQGRNASRAENTDAVARAIARELAAEIQPRPTAPNSTAEDITAGGARVTYQGDGIFVVNRSGADANAATIVDLKHIRHSYDPAVDKDVPTYTNVTLNDVVPRLVDETGREYARITLYQIDPPLVSQPSMEAGINRGTDFRDPSNLAKGTYSNYVSPIFTNDREQRRVASHPIGHFYVKVEIPGYPTVLTGMTTIARADTELADLTIGHELGIGGVLLTPEPGRLNSAVEPLEELTLRQRELRIVDGLYFSSFLGIRSGPEYIIDNGNLVFATYKVPVKNAKDAMAFFVEFIARGENNIFGSLLNRPERGTGSGCTPFAVSWLEAAGVIPFIGEPDDSRNTAEALPENFGANDFWRYMHRTIDIPWSQIGCDDRLGVDRTIPAQYTIFDLLFHNLSREFVAKASGGLAEKIKGDFGFVAGTLFQFGVLTPLRDLVIAYKRKDPGDRGDYAWGKPGEGLKTSFWDNARFSAWVKSYRAHPRDAAVVSTARDGRFNGVAIDAMNVARAQQPFFALAEEVEARQKRLAQTGSKPRSCEAFFALEIY